MDSDLNKINRMMGKLEGMASVLAHNAEEANTIANLVISAVHATVDTTREEERVKHAETCGMLRRAETEIATLRAALAAKPSDEDLRFLARCSIYGPDNGDIADINHTDAVHARLMANHLPDDPPQAEPLVGPDDAADLEYQYDAATIAVHMTAAELLARDLGGEE